MENSNKKELPSSVPYVVYRDSIDDNRWVVKRLTVALIVAISLMFASNLAWLWVFQSYDYSTVETTVDSEGDGIANYTGGDGGVTTYGESNSPKDNPNKADGFDRNKAQNQDTEEVTSEPG